MNTPRTSILVVSYERDYPWLDFLLKSIAKNCSGFHDIVLAIPTQDEEAWHRMYGVGRWNFDCPFVLKMFEEGDLDPHISALYCRCCADEICSGDFVLNIDSDCCFKIPTDPEIYFDMTFGAKPVLLYTPFEVRDGKPWPSHWGACTSEALGHVVEVEVMRRHPSVYHRTTYRNFRNYMEAVHGKDLYEYLIGRKRSGLGAPTFSEFCSLGAFCWYHERNKYRWILDGPERPPDHVWQGWSFHGVDHLETRAKFKEFGLL